MNRDRDRAQRPNRTDRNRVVRDRDRGQQRVVRNNRGNRIDRDRIRRHGRRFVFGPGVTFWFYDGTYYGDCAWLRRQAIITGSDYWWDRYYQCVAW
jgi:hypothetical protein